VEMIEVEYERLPAVFEAVDALKDGAPKIWDNGNLHQKVEASHGNADEALRHSQKVFEADYYTSREHNSPMEPGASLAYWNGDHLTLIAGTQGITTTRQSLSKDLGLPQSKVRVITLYKGGGFGNKNQVMNHDLLAALLSKKTRKPVLLEYDRREDFINVHGRWSANQHLKMGVDGEGRIVAFTQRVYCDVGAYARHPARYNENALPYYDWHAVKSEIYAVYTNTPATGNMRAPDGVAGCFAAETLVDEIAYARGENPLDFRLRNRAQTHHGAPYTSFGLDDCLRLGAEAINWREKWHPAGTGPTVEGKRHGIGMAIGNWHAFLGQGSALVKVNQDGTAHLAVGITDIGTGAKTTMAIIAAEALGIPLDRIQLTNGDTDVTPYSVGESGSRTTSFTGPAVIAAAEDVRRQIFALAAGQLKVKAEELDLRDGEVLVIPPDSKGIPTATEQELRRRLQD